MPSGWAARIKDAVLPFCNDLFERNRLCSAPPWAPLSEKVNTEPIYVGLGPGGRVACDRG